MKIASPKGYTVAVENHGDREVIRVYDDLHSELCSSVAVIGQVLTVHPQRLICPASI